MPSLKERIDADLKEAMRSKDELCTSVLRMLKIAVKYKEVEPGGHALEDGGEIPYLGLTLPIRVNVEPWRTRPGVSRRGGTLHVGVLEPGEEAVRDALVRWYRRRARMEIEATEDNLVKSILIGHHQAAQRHLRQASNDAARRQAHLEDAATEITNIANEGDKRVQAVRQRLKKAGHTHNTDEVTKEDFMFIDSKEKKQLLDLGRKVAHELAKERLEDGNSFGAALPYALIVRGLISLCLIR